MGRDINGDFPAEVKERIIQWKKRSRDVLQSSKVTVEAVCNDTLAISKRIEDDFELLQVKNGTASFKGILEEATSHDDAKQHFVSQKLPEISQIRRNTNALVNIIKRYEAHINEVNDIFHVEKINSGELDKRYEKSDIFGPRETKTKSPEFEKQNESDCSKIDSSKFLEIQRSLDLAQNSLNTARSNFACLINNSRNEDNDEFDDNFPPTPASPKNKSIKFRGASVNLDIVDVTPIKKLKADGRSDSKESEASQVSEYNEGKESQTPIDIKKCKRTNQTKGILEEIKSPNLIQARRRYSLSPNSQGLGSPDHLKSCKDKTKQWWRPNGKTNKRLSMRGMAEAGNSAASEWRKRNSDAFRGQDTQDRVSNEPFYKYHDVVRKKNERDALPAETCKECDLFFSLNYGEQNGGDAVRTEKLHYCSRHRRKYIPPSTPPHYWSIPTLSSTPSNSQGSAESDFENERSKGIHRHNSNQGDEACSPVSSL